MPRDFENLISPLKVINFSCEQKVTDAKKTRMHPWNGYGREKIGPIENISPPKIYLRQRFPQNRQKNKPENPSPGRGGPANFFAKVTGMS